MTHKIIISNSAFSDLEQIEFFIAGDNRAVAKAYVSEILDKIETLSQFPYKGSVIKNSFFDYAKARFLICLNHIVIYQINEIAKCVNILRVLPRFQDWKGIINKDILNKYEILIESNRLIITKMNPSMVYDVYRNSLDEDNRKFVPDEVFESVEEASDVIDFIMQSYDSKDGPFIYAIIRKEDNTNIGYVQLVKIDEGWEIGYHIAKIFTKKGYASEAVELFIKYLKNNTELEEIYGIALASNKASRRVLEKCNFNLIFVGTGNYQGRKRKIIKTIRKIMR